MNTKMIELAERIEDAELRELTREVLHRAPAAFWSAAASTTGKHHPAHALGYGGLVRHTLAVFACAEHLLAAEGDALTPFQRSVVLAGALVHDVCKVPVEGEHSVFAHPLRAAELVQQTAAALGVDANTAAALAAVVASHMGRFNTSPKYHPNVVLPRPVTPEQRLLHYADYLASRKDVAFARPPHVWPDELCVVAAGARGVRDDAGHELYETAEEVRGVCKAVFYDEEHGEVMVRVAFALQGAADGRCRAWLVPHVFVTGTGEGVLP